MVTSILLEVPLIRSHNICMIIKIGDIVEWNGEEYLVVGNVTDENSPGYNVQLREVTEAGYDVPADEVKVVCEHSYGTGHVCNDL